LLISTIMRRKVIVLAVAILQLVVLGSLVVWHSTKWHDDGWAGLTYAVGESAGPEGPTASPVPPEDLRRVIAVIPGSPADLESAIRDTVLHFAGSDLQDDLTIVVAAVG
jgi:hypothetical protein